MSFALRLAGVPKAERDRKVDEAARILHLESYLDRKPGQLSGGQRQRVAIGRAIVRNPKIFLFDEPLSNLDAALRGQMRGELARLHESFDATMIYVTHDQVEAMTMADRIVVLQSGRIEQVGTPLEIYRHPVNRFVAGFMGSPPMNMLAGRIVDADATGIRVALPGNTTIHVAAASDSVAVNDTVTLGVRPEGMRQDAAGSLNGTTHLVERLGSISLVHVELDHGGRVIAQVGGQRRYRAAPAKSLWRSTLLIAMCSMMRAARSSGIWCPRDSCLRRIADRSVHDIGIDVAGGRRRLAFQPRRGSRATREPSGVFRRRVPRSLRCSAGRDLEEGGVDISFLKRSARPTPLVLVSPDARGHPSYTFYAHESAVQDVDLGDVPRPLRTVDYGDCPGFLRTRGGTGGGCITCLGGA